MKVLDLTDDFNLLETSLKSVFSRYDEMESTIRSQSMEISFLKRSLIDFNSTQAELRAVKVELGRCMVTISDLESQMSEQAIKQTTTTSIEVEKLSEQLSLQKKINQKVSDDLAHLTSTYDRETCDFKMLQDRLKFDLEQYKLQSEKHQKQILEQKAQISNYQIEINQYKKQINQLMQSKQENNKNNQNNQNNQEYYQQHYDQQILVSNQQKPLHHSYMQQQQYPNQQYQYIQHNQSQHQQNQYQQHQYQQQQYQQQQYQTSYMDEKNRQRTSHRLSTQAPASPPPNSVSDMQDQDDMFMQLPPSPFHHSDIQIIDANRSMKNSMTGYMSDDSPKKLVRSRRTVSQAVGSLSDDEQSNQNISDDNHDMHNYSNIHAANKNRINDTKNNSSNNNNTHHIDNNLNNTNNNLNTNNLSNISNNTSTTTNNTTTNNNTNTSNINYNNNYNDANMDNQNKVTPKFSSLKLKQRTPPSAHNQMHNKANMDLDIPDIETDNELESLSLPYNQINNIKRLPFGLNIGKSPSMNHPTSGRRYSDNRLSRLRFGN